MSQFLSLKNKKIFVTGHNGFTGTWACLWLQKIGANICGISLENEKNSSFFKLLNMEEKLISINGDINNYEFLLKSINKFNPDLILHLAAQPLVGESFIDPLKTFSTNAIGTANILEAASQCPNVKGIVCVTTDKVYKNNKQGLPFKENDLINGSDPYSASKVAAENIIEAYRNDLWKTRKNIPNIAIARGGNIIGGGDWSKGRLIPDIVKAKINQSILEIRSPYAIRPWQHVLALVYGYFLLLEKVIKTNQFNGPWNFGPHDEKKISVIEMIKKFSNYFGEQDLKLVESIFPEHEILSLDSSKARNLLNWNPIWESDKAIEKTAIWYKNYIDSPSSAIDETYKQIDEWNN